MSEDIPVSALLSATVEGTDELGHRLIVIIKAFGKWCFILESLEIIKGFLETNRLVLFFENTYMWR